MRLQTFFQRVVFVCLLVAPVNPVVGQAFPSPQSQPTESELAVVRAALPCICCPINPCCKICIDILNLTRPTTRSTIAEGDLAKFAASPWLRDVAACATKSAAAGGKSDTIGLVSMLSARMLDLVRVDQCLASELPRSAPGQAWSARLNPADSSLVITNEGNREDTALLVMVAEDLLTGEITEIRLSAESEVVRLKPGRSAVLYVPLLGVFNGDRTRIEVVLFSATRVGRNGDGVTRLVLD